MTDFFRNKWIVITGAAHGIGREFAIQLAQKGSHLLLSDIDMQSLDVLESKLRKEHPHLRIATKKVDVSNRNQMEEWVTEIQQITSVVDIVFNNAGITVTAQFHKHSWEDWERVIGVNVWGVIYGCRLFLPLLQKSSAGRIVNMSSLFGIIAMPNQAAYCLSKYAVRGLSEALWEEFRDKIEVTVVHPGGIQTKIIERNSSSSQEYQNHLADFFRHNTMKVDSAVRFILQGIERGKRRIVVTKEAVLFDRVKRMFPIWGNRWCYRQIHTSMKLQEVDRFMD